MGCALTHRSDHSISGSKATSRSRPRWRVADALIVRLCDALQQSCDISEDFWSELRGEFAEMALLELLLVIGKYRQVCILTNALRLEREAGTPAIPRP